MKKLMLIMLSLILIAGLVSAVQPPRPFSYWRLDESQGSNFSVDQIGRYNLLQMDINHWTQFGKIRNGYNISQGDNATTTLNLTSSMNWTFTMWINQTGDMTEDGRTIFGTGNFDDDGSLANAAFNLGMFKTSGLATSNKMDLSFYGSGSFDMQAKNAFVEGRWYFLTVTIANGNVSFYINGTFDNSLPNANYTGFNPNLTLAFFRVPTNSLRMENMTIDEIGVFNRILTQAEITYLYNSGAGFAFPYNFVENNQTFVSPVQELTTNPFSINISYDPNVYSSVSAVLNYNRTQYGATMTGGNGESLFSVSVLAPSVTVNTNVPFFWNISLTNSSGTFYFNSSNFTQTVVNANFDDCSVYSNVILNFTLFDEDNKIVLPGVPNNNSFQITAKIGDTNLNNFINVSFNKSQTTVLTVCSQNPINQTYRLDYTILYSATGYSQEAYNVQNASLTNLTLWQNVSLFDLLNSRATVCYVNAKDENFNLIANTVLEMERIYVGDGSHPIVEAPLTDSTGNTLVHVVINDVRYNFFLRQNNRLLGSFINVQPTNPSGVCQLNLKLQGASANPDSLQNIYGITYTEFYNSTTKTETMTFTSSNSTAHTVTLTGVLSNQYQNQTICTQTVTSLGDTLTCAVTTPYQNSTVLFRGYSDGFLVFTRLINVPYAHSELLDKSRYILAAFLIPLGVLMALSSPAIALILLFLGLIFCSAIYLIDIQSSFGAGSFLVWIGVFIIILIIKVSRGGIKNG